jgi:hypothetical protein
VAVLAVEKALLILPKLFGIAHNAMHSVRYRLTKYKNVSVVVFNLLLLPACV